MNGERTVRVDLPGRAYDIRIATGLLDRAGPALRDAGIGPRALIVADATVARLHGDRLTASCAAAGMQVAVAAFPAGEPSKTVATAERIWSACAEHRLARDGAIIALGGGVAGDLAGFAAACWMRGIAFAQVPTTLLAMVDSSVGGKTGVNSAAGKNLVGAFQQPRIVLIDTAVLATMEPREYRAGLAEVRKYGVINDPAFLVWQEAHAAALAARDPAAVAHAVAESCRIKALYVVADEHEQGVRAHLNYGHTFGHALEKDGGYTRYLHGEGVGIGMVMAAALSRRLGQLADPALEARQRALLAAYGLPAAHAGGGDADALTRLCGLDKKVAAGRMRFITVTRPGEVTVRAVDDAALVADAFRDGFAP